jgi:two-component system, NtrC family, sensor kinase
MTHHAGTSLALGHAPASQQRNAPKPGLTPSRILRSISFRISTTCWLVTLLALALYVTVNLPQQKKDLRDALKSKAQGVSSSLQDVTAGAAMSEDYSTVVDHCVQVLKGDEAIEYLVITKADGFSVVVDRIGWRTETLGRFWRPVSREVIGEIAYVPLIGKSVFRYARPLDYSAIQWGWVNVGLSTAAYDRSVARVYQRSALLAVLGAGLSLMFSFGQARRLVRPIITLQGVVGQVAGGDLSARAELGSGDEVEDLARCFNSMADTILDRNRILESVRFAGQQLLSADDWTGIVDEVLAKIGQAAGVSRAYIFENGLAPDDALLSTERYEWLAPGIHSTIANWQSFAWTGSLLEEWARRLGSGQVVSASFPQSGGQYRGKIDQSLRSVISTPIRVGGAWWGLLGFDECVRDREWGDAEKDSFQAVADMLGAAIARQRAKQALQEVNESLERRVLERTRELQQQVGAKEEAYVQLAEAQQRFMALSRQAGMAEVATGVLHNVGNVLNSVNVSATIVANKIRDSRIANVAALSGMLEEHSGELSDFLSRDPKGQRVVPYLSKLGSHLEQERQVMLQELELLTGHIGHIKQIVATQQSYAKVSGLIERVSLPELVEDAIGIVEPGLGRHGIRMERDETLPLVAVDKHSVLQILLNLLRNAKEAIKDSDHQENSILVRIHSWGEDRMRISVQDTGMGLPQENLTQVFSHGFTTRRDGHGFGLHSGANAARQMGGALWAESDGPGRGATFTLELPLNARTAKETQPV